MINKNWCVSFILSLAVLSCLYCNGGGVDIGNPQQLTGTVLHADGSPAKAAMVILAKSWVDAGVSLESQSKLGPGVTVIFTTEKPFETTFTASDGSFRFDSLRDAQYIVTSWNNGTAAIEYLQIGTENYTELRLNKVGRLITRLHDNKVNSRPFVAARIKGTSISAIPDSSGVLSMDSVPTGFLNLCYYRNDSTSVGFEHIKVDPLDTTVIEASAGRPVTDWIVKNNEPRNPLTRPFILWSSLENSLKSNLGQNGVFDPADMEIQFSHPMDTRRTSTAVRLETVDTLLTIKSVVWQGSDLLRIDFKRNDSLSQKFLDGIRYSLIIDTIASSAFGVQSVYPETLSFIPQAPPQ